MADSDMEVTAVVAETPLDSVVIAKAIRALFKYNEEKVEEGKTSIVGNYAQPILAQINLHETLQKSVLIPKRVDIPHSLFDTVDEDNSICFFCKSSDKKLIEEHIAENPVEGLTKVISMDEVRKYANLYKDIKELLTSHTHFFCDFGIVPELYNSLGRTFSKTNKLPVPIRLKSPAKIGEALKAAVSATYIRLKDQTRIINIRIGLTSMSEEEVVANVLQGVTNACLMIENTWNNVRSVGLKIPTSPSLPIYAKRLDESHVHPSKANHKKSEAISGKKRKATGDIEETGEDSSTPVVLSIRARKREEKETKEAAAEKSLAHAAKIERKKIARKAKAAAATKVSDVVVVKAPVKATKAAVKKEVKPAKVVVEAVVETKAPATASKKKGKKGDVVVEMAVVEAVAETKAPATASKKRGKKGDAVEEVAVVEAVVETKAPATASKKKGKKADTVEEMEVVEAVSETKAPATASKKKGKKADAVEEIEVVLSVETASKKKTPASAKKVSKTK